MYFYKGIWLVDTSFARLPYMPTEESRHTTVTSVGRDLNETYTACDGARRPQAGRIALRPAPRAAGAPGVVSRPCGFVTSNNEKAPNKTVSVAGFYAARRPGRMATIDVNTAPVSNRAADLIGIQKGSGTVDGNAYRFSPDFS